jgi:nucleotide-binding universal stress UspA family protein
MYNNILVGTDGSEPADRAIEHALALAERYDATVHVISVIDTGRFTEPALSSTELVVEELEDRAQRMLQSVSEQGERMDVDVRVRCCHGSPDEEIVTYADEIDADLTILGSTGLSREGHHIGSVSDRVARDTDRAIMLT